MSETGSPSDKEITELIAWLEQDEAGSREYRARRLARLLKAFHPTNEGMGFWGGIASAQSFTEMRLAYIHGLYLSTVLLALACVEQELAGLLYAAGWEKAKSARLEILLQEAHGRQVISDSEIAAFNHLRDVRNAYAHYRAPGDSTTWIGRAMDQNMLLEDILETDASTAVEALGSFFRRRLGYC